MDGNASKTCGRCERNLPLTREFFPRHPGTRDGFTGVCRECKKAARNRRNANDREKINTYQRDLRERQSGPSKERARERARDWYTANSEKAKKRVRQRVNEAKAEMFAAYGDKCACCGETEKKFLTLDHIENDGASHRRSLGGSGNSILFDLKKRGWPKDGFRILCFNCNCGRERNGGTCPHEMVRRVVPALAPPPY